MSETGSHSQSGNICRTYKGKESNLSLPMMNPAELECGEHIKKMTCDHMERALYRQSRRPAERIRGDGAPQTARALLEENKQLVLEKKERKALERQSSREFVDRILAKDRIVNEADKAKDIGRRIAQAGLAQYYKAKINEKEVEKSKEYEKKLASGVAIQFFPFVEGETIGQARQAEAAKTRDEMRSFLEKQRTDNPPRVDPLMLDSDLEYQHRYPYMPVYSQSARGPVPPSDKERSTDRACSSARAKEGNSAADSGDAAPHMARHPKFLSRAQAHMSRRIQDMHVRKALEDKVERTKAELEEQTRRRAKEAQQWEDGMMVNDALRYDGTQIKVVEKQANADFLKSQIQERRRKLQKEVEDRRAEPAGYFGPEEKQLQDSVLFRNHCSDLISQMEVNQSRRLDSRSKRIDQERKVIDNSLADMSADRSKEREKINHHREVLKQTWQSQQKIRQVMNRIDRL